MNTYIAKLTFSSVTSISGDRQGTTSILVGPKSSMIEMEQHIKNYRNPHLLSSEIYKAELVAAMNYVRHDE